MGFAQVYRYKGGKRDWFAFGLPREGGPVGAQAGDLLRADAPTCSPSARLASVVARVHAAGWDVCVVVDGRRVVLGLLTEASLQGDPRAEAAQVMERAPSTYRPYARLDRILKQMNERHFDSAPVTDSDGVLLGLLQRAAIERAVQAAQAPASRQRGPAGE